MPLNYRKRSVFFRNRLALLVFAVIVFFAILNFSGATSWIWDKTSLYFSPLVWRTTYLKDDFYQYISSIIHIKKIITENSNLKAKMNEMRAKNLAFDELSKENKILKNQLEITNTSTGKMVLASVLDGAMSEYVSTLRVNVGSSAGVGVGNLAIFENVFLGKVIEVENNYSTVMLLADLNSVYSVDISSGDKVSRGVLSGELSQEYLIVKNVEKNSSVEIGDKVYLSTTGLSIDLPYSFIVGTVMSITDNPSDAYKKLRVRPEIDYSDLKEIFILLNYNE